MACSREAKDFRALLRLTLLHRWLLNLTRMLWKSGFVLAWRPSTSWRSGTCWPWVRPEDYPHSSEDWEIQRSRGHWSTRPNVRQLQEDYPVTGDSVQPLMYNAIGGSTIHYTGCWPRFRPANFRKGTEHGLAPD